MGFEFVYVGALLMPFCVYCLVGLAVVLVYGVLLLVVTRRLIV